MTAVSKNNYIDQQDETVNKYNNTYYRTIKMKPADVMSGTYIEYGVENKKNPKFKVDDCVRIPKYKNSIANSTLQIVLRSLCDQGNKKCCAMDLCY